MTIDGPHVQTQNLKRGGGILSGIQINIVLLTFIWVSVVDS
jgi:hypothetical protein